MGWVPVSPHGINAAEPLAAVPAMAVSGGSLYAPAYYRDSDRDAELWSAAVGDEHWRLVSRISGMRHPETIAVHGGTDDYGTIYVGGSGIDNSAMLVRFHKMRGTQALALPVTGGRVLASLLSMGTYLFATIDRGTRDAADATIWRTSRPSDPGAWVRIAPEISAGRGHIHSIKLGKGRPNELLAGTARETPGGEGDAGTGAEVWRGTDNGARWERLVVNGFGDPNTGAVPALQAFRDAIGSDHIYASTLNHTAGSAGSTVYKIYSAGRWSAMPYGTGWTDAPIRSMASFEGRLFIAEGNNFAGANLYYTIRGEGWILDSFLARPYDFRGSRGEVPQALLALTPVYVSAGISRQRYLYMAAQYQGAGVKIWRRTLDLWDYLRDSFVGRVILPSPSRRQLT
jgi:hypothetical protein